MLSNTVQFVKTYRADIIVAIGVLLVSLLSFAAGYLGAKENQKEPIRIEETTNG